MMQKISIKSFIYLRILACFGIVVLHTLFSSKVYFNLSDNNYMWVDIFQNLLMWAVPVFLMITGTLLLDPKKELGKSKVIKYLVRVVIALVVFTFIYQLLDSIYSTKSFNFINTVKLWATKLLTGQSWAPIWYLYLMIGLYLMIPFYRMITKNASMKQIGMLIAIFVVFVSIIPLIKIDGHNLGFYIPTSLIYPCYLFLGYFIFNNKIPKLIYVVLLLFSTIVIIQMTFIRFFELKNVDGDLSLGYENLLVIMQSVGLFGVLKDIKLNAGLVVKSIDKSTFGIYLIHIILIKMIMAWGGFNPYTFSKPYWVAVVLIMDIMIFVLSYEVSLFIRTISKGKMI